MRKKHDTARKHFIEQMQRWNVDRDTYIRLAVMWGWYAGQNMTLKQTMKESERLLRNKIK